ncbi:hypothetical protein AGQ68_24345, partial [Salmonella enterica subsp. enterica]|nr:hypothetical protein [Salmonella enterica subsp. enterica]
YVGVPQPFLGENVTQTVIQTRHTNGCSIPNILKRGNRYFLHFRLPSGGFFLISLGCDSASRARFISSRLTMFISLVKSSKMESAQPNGFHILPRIAGSILMVKGRKHSLRRG